MLAETSSIEHHVRSHVRKLPGSTSARDYSTTSGRGDGSVPSDHEIGGTENEARSRRSFLTKTGAIVTSAVTVGLAGCSSIGFGSGSGEPADGTLVRMTSEFAYEPDTLTIPVGETVVWRTEGFTPHTVTAYQDGIPAGAPYFASGGFETEQAAREGYTDGGGSVGRDEEYRYTFEVPGTYEYFCIPHESDMVGTLSVREES